MSAEARFQRAGADVAEKALFEFVVPALFAFFFELQQLVAVQVSEDVIIAGTDGINQAVFHGLCTIPRFPGRQRVDIQLRAVGVNVLFEEIMGDGEFVAELFAVSLAIFTKDRQVAFVLTGSVFFVADAVLFEQFVEVG